MYEELVYTLRYDAGWLEQGMTQTEHDIAEHLKKAADAIEELSKPRWIPLTERLPEMHDEVLICNEDYGKTDLGFATVALWDGSDWINAWNRAGTLHYVTHWLPLPEPPKEEA